MSAAQDAGRGGAARSFLCVESPDLHRLSPVYREYKLPLLQKDPGWNIN